MWLLLLLLTMPIVDGDYGRDPWWPHPHPAIYPTAYSWRLGGANCDSDCGHTALTYVGDELFSRTAACPTAWLGHVSTTVLSVSWDGGQTWQDWFCIDSFGTAENQRLTYVNHVPVYRVDFAVHPPADFPYHGVYNWMWRKRWEPMSEFYSLREQWKAEN